MWHRLLLVVLCFFFVAKESAAPALGADRPNIVWIVSEDNSKHYLKLFDKDGAATPNIDKLAEQGFVFPNAFSNSPVCSVARTTLATSVYAPRLGTQYHRRAKMATLPQGWKMFPAYLREAGYYTTNNSKKDYNAVEGKGVWDESSRKASWRNRKDKAQPFFHMESHGASHESSLHFNENTHRNQKTATDPDKVKVFPYHPDTPLFRYTVARYHDRIKEIDNIVGRTVAKLKDDGVLEDTFIFYFGDHGGVLPRGKGYIQESGLNVPLVIRVPENFKHLVDGKPGTRQQGFVEFVDFGATALHLAGVEVPKHFDGEPFLGKGVSMAEVNKRNEAFGYADRFDEKYEMVRSLRRGKYKYLRYYQGYYPDALQNNYRYRMLAYKEWRQLWKQGKLNAVQKQFFEAKPAEALYDIEADPHETKNLAGDPSHKEKLLELRKALRARVKSLNDLSFYPESVMVDEAMNDPVAFGKKHRHWIDDFVDVADFALLPTDEALPKLRKVIASENPWARYWAFTACAMIGRDAKPLADVATQALNDDEPLVRLRAVEFLAIATEHDPRPAIKHILKTSDDYLTAAITLNSVAYFQDFLGYDFNLKASDVKAKGNSVSRRLEYLTGKPAPKPKRNKNKNKSNN